MKRITLSQLQDAIWESERPLSPDEFNAIANAPMMADELEEFLERIEWFQRRYPTPAERLAYNNRVMEGLVRPMPIRPTAMLTEAWVGKGGVRADPKSPGSVHMVLMNVLRWTDTYFEARRDLLNHVIQNIDCSHESVLLTPAGYFGWDTRTGHGRSPVRAEDMDRYAVRRFLDKELALPEKCLLALGLDDIESQHFVFKCNRELREITRGKSSREERRFSFGGLTFFGTICYEFQANDRYGPMYPGEPKYFDAERDIKDQGIDIVLNAAHINVKCSQRANRELNRFPFERFMIGISQAGAACFLAHHHPAEKLSETVWKNHCYSNWGIFAGQGTPEDWMSNDIIPKIIDIE